MMLISMACRHDHFTTDWYARSCQLLGLDPEIRPSIPASHRKRWEWAAIIQALGERDMLRPGKCGRGFAVGTERLPSIFASKGVQVLASDAPNADVEAHWTGTGEHASSREALFYPDCISREDFDERVGFTPIDMNNLDNLPGEEVDFLWSSCAMEHLGSLDAGAAFVKNAMRLLKPGGVAVHTTEINCSSNDETAEAGWNVIYRRRDLERLADELRLQRCGMEPFDFNLGTHPYDLDYDEEPYFTSGSPHLKLLIGTFVSTSFLMIISKGH